MVLILFGAACCWAVLLCFVVVLCRATKQADGELAAGPRERRTGERRRSDRAAAAVLGDRFKVIHLRRP